LYNASLLLVDVHIVRTRGFNNSSLNYGGSKRGGGFEIACAHFSPEMADHKDLKLCTILHYHLEMCILSGQEDPIIFLSCGRSKLDGRFKISFVHLSL
jgi:hypothetical protein